MGPYCVSQQWRSVYNSGNQQAITLSKSDSESTHNFRFFWWSGKCCTQALQGSTGTFKGETIFTKKHITLLLLVRLQSYLAQNKALAVESLNLEFGIDLMTNKSGRIFSLWRSWKTPSENQKQCNFLTFGPISKFFSSVRSSCWGLSKSWIWHSSEHKQAKRKNSGLEILFASRQISSSKYSKDAVQGVKHSTSVDTFHLASWKVTDSEKIISHRCISLKEATTLALTVGTDRTDNGHGRTG